MSGTREKILLTALELFAREGYEAVSVSRIAGALGMTKGALYRHYESKRDIFESILARMEQRDAEQARNHDLPETPRAASEEAYRTAGTEDIAAFGKTMFRYWTQDPFASAFRRMLTVEQFRSPEMGALYQQYLASGPLGYVRDLLSALEIPEPEKEAAALYAPMFLLYGIYDAAEDRQAVTDLAYRLLDDAGERLQNLYKTKGKQNG